MKPTLLLSLMIVSLSFMPASPAHAAATVGQPAPAFALSDTNGKAVYLSDYKGKKSVVLAFYVLAFTGG